MLAALLLTAAAARAELPRPVARAFLDAGVPLTHVAVTVQRVDARRPLFAHQPDAPMNPASVMKLVTTFAALELLGRDYRWRTEAYLGGPLVDGVLHGDLIVKGRGGGEQQRGERDRATRDRGSPASHRPAGPSRRRW